ncbi:MAG: sulfatase [Acidobacteriia bacterium]|nr:sulfatase [Terriglobia bacterium]
MEETSLRTPRLLVALALVLTSWWVFLLLDVLVMVAVRTTAVHEGHLPPLMRLAMVLTEALAAIGPAVLVGGVLVVENLCRGAGWPSALARRSARVLAVTVSTLLVMLLLTSWAAFVATGRFADVGGLRFWASNAVQFTQHVAQMKASWLVGAPLVSVAAAALLGLGVPRFVRELGTRTLAVVVAVGFGFLGLSALGVVAVKPRAADRFLAVVDPHSGITYTLTDLVATCRRDRAGPLAHFALDLDSRLHDSPEEPRLAPEVRIIHRPIVSMAEYLSNADPNRLHRWNVIVILVESLRWDQIEECGGTREVMPAVESIAREGHTFSNAYTESSHSNYADLCPLSSNYPLRAREAYVYPKQITYPRVLIYDVLKALGYRTAVISSQNENWGGMINFLSTGGIDHFLHSETYTGSTYVPRNDIGFTGFIAGSKRSGKIDDRLTVGEAISWIDQPDTRPFFIYMNLQNSHVPYELPADFPPRFGTGKRDFDIFFGSFPPEKVDEVKDLYANSLAYVDAQIGRLVQHLKARRLWDRTLVVVTGDNGQAFLEHGFAAHAGMIFNEVMRVPIIVRAPGMTARVEDRPAQHIDIPPTVLGALGLPPHPCFQGLDLLDPEFPLERSIFLVAQSPLAHQYAIVRSSYKLIYDAWTRRSALFDLRVDPGEHRDLSERLPDIRRMLSARLDTWRRAQIDYYESLDQETRFYPPVLEDR